MKGTTLGLLGGGTGGGGSSGSGGSTNESTVSKVEVVEQDYVGMSSEDSSYGTEAELELGLGLSLGGGGVAEKSKACAWGERGRILTAKDFPSVVSDGISSTPSRFSDRGVNASSGAVAVSGTKRAAHDSFSHEGGSPTGARYDSIWEKCLFIYFFYLCIWLLGKWGKIWI